VAADWSIHVFPQGFIVMNRLIRNSLNGSWSVRRGGESASVREADWKKTIPRNEPISRSNDINSLHHSLRNRSFRIAKHSFRFRRFFRP
jgi:hypothetical protein